MSSLHKWTGSIDGRYRVAIKNKIIYIFVSQFFSRYSTYFIAKIIIDNYGYRVDSILVTKIYVFILL